MRQFAVCLATVTASLGLGACSKDSLSAPSQATATVARLTIAGADAVGAGLSTPYTATIISSNGTSESVTPFWNNSNLDVATVNDDGTLNATRQGSTTVMATYQGLRATKDVAVVNYYGGSWRGDWPQIYCESHDGWSDECGTWSHGLQLTISQPGPSLTRIGATIAIGGVIAGTLTGTVAEDGRLTMTGSFDYDFGGRTLLVKVVESNSSLVSAREMRSRWVLNLIGVPEDDAYYESTLTMTRRSNR